MMNQTPPKEPYSTHSQAFNSPAISNTFTKIRLFGSFGGITTEHPAGSVSPRLPASILGTSGDLVTALHIKLPKPFYPYFDANDHLVNQKPLMLE